LGICYYLQGKEEALIAFIRCKPKPEKSEGTSDD
jgi:hypothetical protein